MRAFHRLVHMLAHEHGIVRVQVHGDGGLRAGYRFHGLMNHVADQIRLRLQFRADDTAGHGRGDLQQRLLNLGVQIRQWLHQGVEDFLESGDPLLGVCAALRKTGVVAALVAVLIGGFLDLVGVAETDLTETLEWQIVAPNGVVVEQGRTIPYGFDSGSGANVQLVVTSGLRTPATNLVLVVGGVGKSHPFDVSEDIFRDLKYDTLRYFYHNRAGVPIESEHAGDEQWARPAGHEKEVLTCFHGKDMYKISWPRCDYTLDVSGGWYDAGDQSKYVVNSGISVWTLLNA